MTRIERSALAATAAALVAVAAACHGDSGLLGPAQKAGLPSCAQGTAILTDPPLPIASINGWVPLGNFNPPAHTFPTDHQYLYLVTSGSPALSPVVPLRAPAAMTITRARRVTYSTDGHTDYSLEFSPCSETYGNFGHVATVRADVLAGLGAFDQQCSTYSPNPGLSVSDCYTRAGAVKVAAGDSIGSMGGASGANSLDFSFWDARVPTIVYANPSRWYSSSDHFDIFHVVPASDYYAEPARSAVAAKVGSFDGRTRRTASPPGGTIAVDVPGTAQGDWMNDGYPVYPEQWHLSIAPDNISPSIMHMSVGLSQANFASGAYSFTPVSSGTINRHPAQVTPGATIYCYDLQFPLAIALLQLVDATTLRFEGRTGFASCTAQQGLAFSSSAITFRR